MEGKKTGYVWVSETNVSDAMKKTAQNYEMALPHLHRGKSASSGGMQKSDPSAETRRQSIPYASDSLIIYPTETATHGPPIEWVDEETIFLF